MELYEEYPSRYPADVSRRHRWMRGDWQIARWLLPRVRGSGRRCGSRNPISALSRWKIFDNLRRSLVPVAMLVLLLVLLAAAGAAAGDGRDRSSCWRWSGPSRCWRCWRTWSASPPTCRC